MTSVVFWLVIVLSGEPAERLYVEPSFSNEKTCETVASVWKQTYNLVSASCERQKNDDADK